MLLGCTDTNATKEIENSTDINVENNIESTKIDNDILYYSKEDAETIAQTLLTSELKEDGFRIIYDREVEISRIEYKNPTFYRFLIEDDFIALETAILINKETGSPLICYPDDTYVSVNDEELFKSNRPFWFGSYGKVEAPDNHYTVLTISQSLEDENSLYFVMNSYYGAGVCVMKFNATFVDENKVIYENNEEKIEIVLNNDNTLTVNVESEDLELIEMLDGKFA